MKIANLVMKDLKIIIEKCINSDRVGQYLLYDFTYKNLITAIALYTKDKTERDWVFNLGMLKVFSSLKNYQLGTNYLGWARTILVRSAIDHIRKNKSYNDQLAPVEVDDRTVNLSELNDALNTLENESLIKLIQSIPENERLIFTMYEIDGYTHTEIEKMTSINKNTSKWLLGKARKSLQKNAVIFFDLKLKKNGE